MALTELERVLMARLEEKDEKAEKSDDYYKWWREADAENDKLKTEVEELRKRNDDLESQILELSQAKIVSVMLTDSNAKGVL